MTEVNERSRPGFDLSTPVQYVKGVGPARARTFAQLGVETVGDLLEYFPRNWNFLPEPMKIDRLQPNEKVTIIGMIESTDYQSYRRHPMFEALISDETGICRILWFHGGYLRDQLEPGQIIMVSGKVTQYKHQLQLTNPKFLVLEAEHEQSPEHFSGGVYPACKGLSSGQIKKIIGRVREAADQLVPEFFDQSVDTCPA
ncbi:MAG: OB-fold nucleic acid binding domain-containing protein [Planctomycetota bacterium]|jgi:ATP-dependent DNA helicase RecG